MTGQNETSLILAAEDCDENDFESLHRFSLADERVIAKLIAHGPVLVRGGRGSGKSALMIEASRRLAPKVPQADAFALYISLRHLELLRKQPGQYERALCEIINLEMQRLRQGFSGGANVTEMRNALAALAGQLGKRIVLFFDDAAHIGRETSVGEFFDVFRTIASSYVSCKAAIYPGVTHFGTRFDVFNDATVIDVTRTEDMAGFAEFFLDIMTRRSAALVEARFTRSLPQKDVAAFLGRAVVGNMRAFVFACSKLDELTDGGEVRIDVLSEVLLDLASNHFWPLLEELRPKLGIYQAMVDPARRVAEAMFQKAAEATDPPRRMITVHRDNTERLAKPFEMLEYTGFIAKREGSRALKSGGRGPRYALNLCNLLERVRGSRLTSKLMDDWTTSKAEPAELSGIAKELTGIHLPETSPEADLQILDHTISSLAKSKVYPYGLTAHRIESLQSAGFDTIRKVADSTDEQLMGADGIGQAWCRRIRNVVGQAIWM